MTESKTDPERPQRSFGAPATAIHMVRTTQQAHYQLSQMADQKASILMGATFVTFTLTLGQARAGSAPSLPLMILGAFAFVSAVLAVMAVLPATAPRRDGPVNLLFFGSFVRFSQEEYIDHMLDALCTDESVYRTMATDIYQNGRVLAGKKYRLLGYAYRAFLAGLTLSLVAFLVETLRDRI
jgi:hypothetical protein